MIISSGPLFILNLFYFLFLFLFVSLFTVFAFLQNCLSFLNSVLMYLLTLWLSLCCIFSDCSHDDKISLPFHRLLRVNITLLCVKCRNFKLYKSMYQLYCQWTWDHFRGPHGVDSGEVVHFPAGRIPYKFLKLSCFLKKCYEDTVFYHLWLGLDFPKNLVVFTKGKEILYPGHYLHIWSQPVVMKSRWGHGSFRPPFLSCKNN